MKKALDKHIKIVTVAFGALATLSIWPLVGEESLIVVGLLGVYILSPWAFLVWMAQRSFKRKNENAVLGLLIAMALMAAVTYVLILGDETSTAVLALVFLPLYQWTVAGIVVGVATLRDRGRGVG